MILIDPVKDFFVRAAVCLKQKKIKDLNELEAELIMTEEDVLELKRHGISPETLNSFENRIIDMKILIRHRKEKL